MQKVLTISIAAYNVEKYLRKTLDSLIIENMDLLEVLIIVDGCKDKTLDIAKEYEKRYPDTFKAIYKENGGYGSTINKGIELATGKYFKQLDGDDWFDTKNLNTICIELKNIDEDIIYTPYIKYNEVNEKKSIIDELKDIDRNENILNNIIDNVRYMEMHALMYRTNLLKENKIKIDENCFYTDTEYAVYPLYYAKTIKKLNYALYVYRIGREGQSISVDGKKKHYKDFLNVRFKLLEKISNSNYDLQEKIYNYLYRNAVNGAANCIKNYLLLFKPNKEKYNEIKEFENKIKKLNPNAYKEMESRSKFIKIMRKGKYIIYKLCYILNKLKNQNN